MSSSLFSNQAIGNRTPTTTAGTTASPIDQLQQIKNSLSMLKNSKNPQAMLQTMAMQNPLLSKTMNDINQNYGGDARSAFYAKARAQGMNDQQINEFLGKLKI